MKRRIFIVILLLNLNFLFFCGDMKNCIILWSYNENFFVEEIQNKKIIDIQDKYKIAYEISLDEFCTFDEQKNKFVFKENSDLKDKILHIGDSLYNHIEDGYLFFSIVIDDKIIFTGINRISVNYAGAAMHEGDELGLSFMVQTVDNSLKITEDYSGAIFFDYCEEYNIGENLYKALQEYYSK